jgi:hypothetical protein
VQMVCLGGALRGGCLGDVPRANVLAIPDWGILASVGKLHQGKACGRRQMSLVPPSSVNIHKSTTPVAIVCAD